MYCTILKYFLDDELIALIDRSTFFDRDYYLSQNVDVRDSGMDAATHYYFYGYLENRAPSNLRLVVKYNNVCPVLYYELVGKYESKCGNKESISHHIVSSSKYFNPKWYLKTYVDVKNAKINPAEHYISNGWREGRDPSPYFSTNLYLKSHPSIDVCPILFFELVELVKNPNVTVNYSKDAPQQMNYRGEYQINIDYSSINTDVKTFAFYLPQFHKIPENDLWWGEGFTEWTNTKKALPCYEGHYEPRDPHDDIGYYDLSGVDAIKKQVELAKQHKITGFAYYYYWFSGKRLLEKPMDLLLNNPDLDIEFCIIWANENWTRTWDGLENDVLIDQKYSEQDPYYFIKDIKKYVVDERYLRVDGCPVIIIYAPNCIPDLPNTIKKYRDAAVIEGIGEIKIWICRIRDMDARKLGVFDLIDGEVQFPPHNLSISPEFTIQNMGETAYVFDYGSMVSNQINLCNKENDVDCKYHRSVMLAWDNSPRRSNFSSFSNFDYKSYYDWLSAVTQYTKKTFSNSERIQFINAWNEWAEGTYLEPDKMYGYANINHTSQAILGRPYCGMEVIHSTDAPRIPSEYFSKIKIAIHAHIFYVDLIEEIVNMLNNIPLEYDLYISTDLDDKVEKLRNYLKDHSSAKHCFVEKHVNRGRDVAPFLIQMAKRINEYDYVCHIHSKKSKHQNDGSFGDNWRRYLYNNLFGSSDYVLGIISLFETYGEIGTICPSTYAPLEKWMTWGSNKELVEELLSKIGVNNPLPECPEFPAGNMFWMRTNAIKSLFELNIQLIDFDEESGQVDATLAHAIERSWYYVSASNGYIWVNYNWPGEEHGGNIYTGSKKEECGVWRRLKKKCHAMTHMFNSLIKK